MKIAFATYRELPELDPDDRPVAQELRRRGCELVPAIWDAEDVDWGAFDAVVMRSCWDYDQRPQAFLDWMGALEESGVALHNPAAVLRWNLDKRHLGELAAAGVGVPPLAFVERGAERSLESVLDELGCEQAVAKPIVSMSANGTWRTSREQLARDGARWAEQLRGAALMLQRFQPEIASEGEISLVYLGGAYSHASRKRPAPGDFRVQNELGGSRAPIEAPAAWVQWGSAVLERCPGPQLYARVDFVPTAEGLLLMEVELIDPSLYLDDAPGSVERFAEAILRVAGA